MRKLRVIFGLFLLTAFSALPLFAAGFVDPTFNASAYLPAGGQVNAILRLPDGKVLIAGRFTSVFTQARGAIARFNADGTLDTTFNSPDFYGDSGLGTTVESIALQSDGKIVVGGFYFSIDALPGNGYVRRLNPNGTFDPTFNPPLIYTDIKKITVQSDDKILVGGRFQTNNGQVAVMRLNADGTEDNSFTKVPHPDPGCNVCHITEIVVQPDGKILYGGPFLPLTRVQPNGATDPSFTLPPTTNHVRAIHIFGNGQILIAGAFTSVNGFTQGGISRLNADGSLDLTFNSGNVGATRVGIVASINDFAISPDDGSITIIGAFDKYNNVARSNFAKLNADGTLNTSFDPVNNHITTGYAVELLPGGKIAAGYTTTTGLPTSFTLAYSNSYAYFNNDGSIANPIVEVGLYGYGSRIAVQPDGKIVLGGFFAAANDAISVGVARYNADGTRDTSFTPPPLTTETFGLALQADGKILLSTNAVPYFYRLNPDGSKDLSFNPPGITSASTDILVLPGGKIFYRNKVYNQNGTLDGSFTFPTVSGGPVHKIIAQPDGKLLIGGDFTQVSGSLRGRIARLNTDGSLDTSFAPPGGANGTVWAIAVAPGGRVVIGGTFTGVNGLSTQAGVGRFNLDGTLDTGFVSNAGFTVKDVVVQTNGKVIAAGQASNGVIFELGKIARFNANGSTDNSFVVGANYRVRALAIQPNGSILAAGEFNKIDGIHRMSIARLLNNNFRTTFDFDGDGRSDLGVFRPSNGTWYLQRSSAGELIQNFGISGDKIAAADYDGDGKTDLAVYRNGDWWYLNSSTGTIGVRTLDPGPDIPLPSDIDYDGKADFVFYRPSTGQWFRYGSTGWISVIQFGIAGDIPLIADIDGDGITDPTIFRPSTGTWWYKNSLTWIDTAIQWGQNGDIPVPGDYDADGKTDTAVFRPSNGVWYVLNSGGGYTATSWGLDGDRPVAADYDGDGKTDIAVWRPSTGVWYILQSTAGFTGMQYGITSDKAIENAFLP